jgi:hypothetical protein
VGNITDLMIEVLYNSIGRNKLIASTAIEAMSTIAAENPAEVDKVAPVLVEMLGVSEGTLFDAADEAEDGLLKIGSLAIPYMIEAFEESNDKEYRLNIVDLLADIEDSYAIEYLAKVLKDINIDADIRGNIVKNMYYAADYKPEQFVGIIPDLISVLGDETELPRSGMRIFSPNVIGVYAADILYEIGELVVLPLQDFIRSGEGNEIALEWASEILEALDAEIPSSSTQEETGFEPPVEENIYGVGIESTSFM